MGHMMNIGGYPPPPSYGPGMQFSGQYPYSSRYNFICIYMYMYIIHSRTVCCAESSLRLEWPLVLFPLATWMDTMMEGMAAVGPFTTHRLVPHGHRNPSLMELPKARYTRCFCNNVPVHFA